MEPASEPSAKPPKRLQSRPVPTVAAREPWAEEDNSEDEAGPSDRDDEEEEEAEAEEEPFDLQRSLEEKASTHACMHACMHSCMGRHATLSPCMHWCAPPPRAPIPTSLRPASLQVADVPFEVLEALRQDGRGPSGRAAREVARAAMEAQKNFHRANRHRPSEMTSKKPVPRFREIIQVTKRELHDPRFEDDPRGGPKGGPEASGRPEANYKFLYDDVIPEERKALRDKMKVGKRGLLRGALEWRSVCVCMCVYV
jgi:hypothetical protein